MNALIGTTVAQRYRIDQFVGSGGMAEVYKVWDNQRSVHLAMKVLREDLAEDEIFLRRFRREAETLSRLQHPNIIRSYGLVQTDQLAFLLMDYIEGTTLRKEIFYRKQAWPLDQVVAVMRPVCAALHYAHTQGLVHCDVKPANIMLTRAGKVFLADFGIARLTESATTATMVGAGTPAYMSPEQIRGEDPQPQTDLYALGIVLFELLTGGERPFTGDHAKSTGSGSEKVRWEQEHSAPPSVRQYNPAVPPEVEALIFKCLEKNPAARFTSAIELLSTLEKACPPASVISAAEVSLPIFTPAADTTANTPPPGGYPPSAGTTPPGYPPAPPYPPVAEVQPVPAPRRAIPGWAIAMIAVVVLVGAFALANRPAVPTPMPPAPAAAKNTDPPVQPSAVRPSAPAATDRLPATQPPSPTRPEATLPPSPTQPRPTTPPSPTAVKVGSSSCSSAGQTMTRPKDKAVMVCVPAGGFPMGYPGCKEAWCQNEASTGNVDVAAFWIDQYEVTNARFQQFVAETNFLTGAEQAGASNVFGINQPVSGANWRSPQGPGSNISGKAEHPVVQMNWYSANAYCQWAAARLPSEAQWEKAARGTDGRLFPWGGDMPDRTYLNAAGAGDGFQYTAPVGSFPAGRSPYGLYDMAGNAFEWTRSLLKPYPYVAGDGREIEGEPGPNDKVSLRGGGFYADTGSVRSTMRAEGTAQISTDATGFRCVIDR